MESEFSERQILQTLFALSQSDGFLMKEVQPFLIVLDRSTSSLYNIIFSQKRIFS